MLEVGRAQRTIFVARYLRSRELQREITEGLNVVDAFNGANSVIYHGKRGEIAPNRSEEQGATPMGRDLHAAVAALDTWASRWLPTDHKHDQPVLGSRDR